MSDSPEVGAQTPASSGQPNGWDLIPLPPVSGGKTVLVLFEVPSGRRYGQWCTPADAEATRRRFEDAWAGGGPISGSVQWGDLSVRSDAVVSVRTSQRRPSSAAVRGVTT